MTITRLLLLVPLCAALALSGCRTRGSTQQQQVLNGENQSEISRLNGELERLQRENDQLKQQAQSAQQNEASVSGQLSDILEGGQIAGAYATGRGSIGLDEDVLFAKGSSELNEAGQSAIKQLADRLNKGEFASARVIVEGHTDDTPVTRPANKEKYVDNWGLSAARAATVVRTLEKAGIDAKRLHGAFRGEHDPSPKAADKSRNRRVELYVK